MRSRVEWTAGYFVLDQHTEFLFASEAADGLRAHLSKAGICANLDDLFLSAVCAGNWYRDIRRW